ncbi:uncharacterized protein CMUS01_12383, partial [Colletotrichum musicola]
TTTAKSSAISKLNAALVSIPQELTVAAASFNLDFSLMKVEAPKEFLGVGDSLSTHRRGEAEDGQFHVTARKLGALFESLVPPVPHLYQAYGKRASEISSRSKSNKSSGGFNPGIFTPQAGPDGTSIWAAATSGRGAIAVHLLACMLARMWKSHEAISIWVELVDRRKQEIIQTYESTNFAEIASLMASKQDFSRQQLASWDASARSWLQTADTDRKLQQTQFTLIIDNVDLPVNAKKDPYESVVEAWVSGMVAMNRLVQGIPQRVQDGSILLAISSWHLYPDMEVLLEEVKHIKQHDELMTESLVTISSELASHNKEGVFWSLPLARLRYYSAPEVLERCIASTTSRITIEEFWIIALGAVVSGWKPFCPSVEKGFGLISKLSQYVNHPQVTTRWLKHLADAVQSLTSGTEMECLQARKLLRLGTDRCRDFLNDDRHPPLYLFGLCNYKTLLSLIPGVEEKVSILRDIGSTLGADPETLIIRYSLQDEQESQPWDSMRQDVVATVLPQVVSQPTYSSDDGEPKHKRQRQEKIATHIRWIFTVNNIGIPKEESWHQCNANCAHEARYEFLLGDAEKMAIFAAEGADIKRPLRPAHSPDATVDEIEKFISSPHIDPNRLRDYLSKINSQQNCSLEALGFATELYDSHHGATVSVEAALKPLYEASWAKEFSRVNSDLFSGGSLTNKSPSLWPEPGSGQGFATHSKNMSFKFGKGDRLAVSFACLAMMETGSFDIDPKLLCGVIALSHGNSIYVRSDINRDPYEQTADRRICRVFGNLGRSEIAFLVPPPSLELERYDINSWHLVNHLPFDGQFEDKFQGTSLHLSFTGFELPVDVGPRGLRDTLVTLIESVVSANDGPKHIGDLDINVPNRERLLTMAPDCNHNRLKAPGGGKSLISIDTWAEFWDPPETTGIFRATGNWQARLAATVASLQLGKRVALLPPYPCLDCLEALEMNRFDIIIA